VVASSLADPARPAEERQRDALRHPGELMAFAGVQPGWKVADYMPGGGYFTRVFSGVVGAKGHVYAVYPQFMANFEKKDVASIQALVADPHYAGNVSYIVTPDQGFMVPGPLDLVWTSQNYHDLQFGLSHDQIVALDKAIFDSLRPGGIFLVIDHVAAPGSGWTVASKLHRIDPEAIKADMAEAGFKLDAESDILRNPDDPHTAVVFDPSIRGRTDQVVFRFKKP
jgi:predicted methyltransferase